MKRRKLTAQERTEIAQRHGATCDVVTVTVCPPCQYTPWEQVQDRWKRQAKRGRESAHRKQKGMKDE